MKPRFFIVRLVGIHSGCTEHELIKFSFGQMLKDEVARMLRMCLKARDIVKGCDKCEGDDICKRCTKDKYYLRQEQV